MPITERQRRLRRGHLGSSDAPAVLGVSPWRTATDVYWSKLVEDASEPTEAMKTGNRLEPALIDFAAERLSRACRRNQYRVSAGADGGIAAANYDALIIGEDAAIEAKYVGPSAADQWGPDGTDEVPDYVQVQVQHQLYVGELDRCYVAAAIAGRHELDWRLYAIPRHAELIGIIVAKEIAFWREHVEPRIPPTDGPPPLAVLHALRREPQSIVDLGPEATAVIDSWQAAKLDLKAAEEACERLRRDVLALLGEAEAGRLSDGRLLTFLQQRSGVKLDASALKAAHPDIYERFAREAKPYRVLRLKEPRLAAGKPIEESAESISADLKP